MQDYHDQATKNDVILMQNGKCQFCGADVAHGVDECMQRFAELCGIDYAHRAYDHVHFMAVDAHALQHSEIHGKINNHFHLLRLYLIFEQGTRWDFRQSPLLSNFIKKYDTFVPLIPPPVLKRGNITVIDVLTAQSEAEHIRLVTDWAKAVYEAWSPYHAWARETAQKYR